MLTKPEYPLAIAMPAHPSNYRTGRRPPGAYLYIVIHITDGRAAPEPVAEMWQKPNHGSTAHFVIGNVDGKIIQGVSLADTAWHAHDVNGISVGIEHDARSPGELSKTDPGLPVSDAQYASSAKLVAWLCRGEGSKSFRKTVLAPTRFTIQGHSDIDKKTTHDDCPNRIWNWPKYMTLVQAAYAALEPVA